MTRVATSLPGYATVARAGEVLHLAPRSVRDLIYAGRLPSLRVGRLHYIKSSDLERERRRRLGLPPAQHVRGESARRVAASAERPTRIRPTTDPVDPVVRRQRAAERAELVNRWTRRHHFVEPRVPATVSEVTTPVTCEACGRVVKSGHIVELGGSNVATSGRLCLACGRRALLDWADQRRLEAQAARRQARALGIPEPGLSQVVRAA